MLIFDIFEPWLLYYKAYFGHFLIQFDFTIFENGMRSLNTFNK